ncbi:universal stress protein [Streptomyces zhihengii]
MASAQAHGAALGPVVAGIDGSAASRAAALWAARTADRRGVPLRLVHAGDLDRLARFASFETVERIRRVGGTHLAEAEEAVHERFPYLPVERDFSTKNPVAALHEAAASGDTVVVGSRGRGGFPALLLGSVGLALAARSPVPVVVVRGQLDRPDTGVVAAAVRDERDAGWVREAAYEAESRRASLLLISTWNPLSPMGHVVPMIEELDAVSQQGQARANALADVIRRAHPSLTVSTEVDADSGTAAALVENSRRVDLLVMGARHRLMEMGSGIGHVGHTVLHHAHCPVEIVPRPPEAPGEDPS